MYIIASNVEEGVNDCVKPYDHLLSQALLVLGAELSFSQLRLEALHALLQLRTRAVAALQGRFKVSHHVVKVLLLASDVSA